MSVLARRISLSLTLAAGSSVIALALPVGAVAASHPPKITMAKQADGPYQSSAPRVNIPAGEAKSIYIKIRSTASNIQKLTLIEEMFPEPADYDFRWFSGHDDVTHDVRTGGFKLKLKSEHTKMIRIHAKAHPSPDPACIDGRFHVQPDDVYGFGIFALNGNPDTICSG